MNEKIKLFKLSQNIQHYRKLKNLSQNELAEKFSISREHLAKLETAKRKISLGLLFKLCDVLGISEKDLFELCLNCIGGRVPAGRYPSPTDY